MDTEQSPVAQPIRPTDAAEEWLTVRSQGPGFRTEIRVGEHTFVADEPLAVGGTDTGPTPYDYLVGALGACTAMTLRMYAGRKGWPLEEVVVRLRNARSYAADCQDCATKPVGFRRLERRIELRGQLTEEQRRRLLEIADRCPVKQTFEKGIAIEAVA
jgi:putative redox protein